MMIAWITVLVALAGLVIYAVATNPKVVRIGEILFFCGTLVSLFALARQVARIP